MTAYFKNKKHMGKSVEPKTGTTMKVSRGVHAMLPANESSIVNFPASFAPRLVVIVDTEEAFDWSAPFSRGNTKSDTRATQGRVRATFERFGIKPTYTVDFPVASQAVSSKPLLELLQAGQC